MNQIEKIKKLVERLNYHCDLYYNKQSPEISDYEYDCMFDELSRLEKETGIIMSNSPTQTVGHEVRSDLEKVTHSHPMLSLGKTKNINDLKKFIGNKVCCLMCKMDGLTILLTYEDGYLVQAETRGNGEVGEIVTHNAKVFDNIPLYIDYPGHLEVEGEAIITYNDFNKINSNISDDDKKYKNPRNLVSGSVRQLDSHIAAKRHIKFIAWKIPKGMDNIGAMYERLNFAYNLGFDVVPTIGVGIRNTTIEDNIRELKDRASKLGYPIDGMVVTYDDIKYGESLGMTGHHPKYSLAFKFYDEEVETVLRDIEWGMGKTGQLTPVAVFDPVEIDGTIVERALLHNVSIMKELELSYGDTITVYKANQIIPQVQDNLDRTLTDVYKPPLKCPSCLHDTKIIKENDTEVLICANPNCQGKLLGIVSHAVSKNALNIDGLSEATIEKFINLGWISSIKDIYHLSEHKYDMVQLNGFGGTSVKKLLESIEKSRNTTLDRFIYSLSVPLIGRSASKTISKYFNGDVNKFMEAWKCGYGFSWNKLDDFGASMHSAMAKFYLDNYNDINSLLNEFTFEKISDSNISNKLEGKVFVITGTLNQFSNRDEAKNKIESLGGKVSGSISAKTSYLVNNDINSTSSKNKKAKQLNIPIITESELLNML